MSDPHENVAPMRDPMWSGGSEVDSMFVRLAAETVDDLLARSPERATALGDHRFDDRLSELSLAGVAERRHAVARRLAELDALDDLALGAVNAVDLEILRGRLTSEEFALAELREHTWNPLVWNPGSGIYPLLARDFAPLPERLRSLASRLSAVPEHLDSARRTLGRMPRVHVETAVVQFGGTRSLLGAEVERALVDDDALATAVRAARDTAVDALDEHIAWLRSVLDDRPAEDDADPRLGDRLYAAKLWHTLDEPTSPDALLALAESDLERIEAELADVAALITGESGGSGGVVRRALDRVADENPVTDSDVLHRCRTAFEAVAAFTRDHDLVTVHDDPVEVIEMPELHRGVAVAYCDPPGPLETAQLPTFFAVAPTPSDWSQERVRSFYREYNGALLHDLTVHEGIPGHVLQLSHARRCAAPTRVRQAFWSGALVEGWAVHAERLVVDAGYVPADVPRRPELAIRLQQLKMALRMCLNTILDVRVHTRGMTEAEALDLLMRRGHQEEGEAVGKWRRALLTSTQLPTYYVGSTAVETLVADLRSARPGWSTRRLNDALLAHGSPPPRHLRTLLDLPDE